MRSRIRTASTYPLGVLTARSGSWGACVATGSQYGGLGPSDSDSELVLVLGDPLDPAFAAEARPPSTSAPNAGTARGLWERFSEGGMEHPSSLVRISKTARSVDVVTDAYLSFPIFWAVHQGVVMLASSPDLLAGIHPTSFDTESAIERLSTGVISYPHTLYIEIKALPPASAITIAADGTVDHRRWWTPPTPDETAKPADLREELHASVIETLRRIDSAYGGRPGALTLSAGLDSRFIAAIATRERLLNFRTVNLAVGNNMPARTAGYIAKRLQIPLERVRRPVDFYSRLFLDGHPELGTNFCLADAHFADGVLGDLGGSPYLIGGYLADTMLKGRSGTAEREAIAHSARTGDSVLRVNTYTRLIEMGPDATSLVHERRREASIDLGITADHGSLVDFVSLHRQSFGHFAAASRNYAVYEPFMTRGVINLSFRTPDAIKQSTPKAFWYEPFLNGKELGPFFRVRRKAERLMRRATRVGLSLQGEWSEREGPLGDQLEANVHRARTRLNESLGVEISTARLGRAGRALVVSTDQALQKCG